VINALLSLWLAAAFRVVAAQAGVFLLLGRLG